MTLSTPTQRRAVTAELFDTWADTHLKRTTEAPKLFLTDIYEVFVRWLVDNHPKAPEPSFRVFVKSVREAGFTPTPNTTRDRYRHLVLRGWRLAWA